MNAVVTKRIYEKANTDDGYRILVDRLWPRGISKEVAALDEWDKNLAPSTELRKWFDHDPEKFTEFKKRYLKELEAKTEELEKLVKKANNKKLTLLYAAKDEKMNEAEVLKDFINSKE